ncbi:MAG: C-terminal helicase domain-containing protein [Planctomycetaceae bacterium]
MAATVHRVVDLWKAGEKCVVFCHYIATGRALRAHISDAIRREIWSMGATKLQCPIEEVSNRLELIGRRFFDEDSPLRVACDNSTLALLNEFPELTNDPDICSDLIESVRRNLRTPAFLVRFFPLNEQLLDAAAVEAAFETTDASGQSLRSIVRQFFAFLAERCAEDGRKKFVDAVKRIQTGSHFGIDAGGEYDSDELQDAQPEQLMPNVRLINGTTRSETRQRLMLTFNTPFYPEILIASSVMAEGVDLHLNCRHIIHHDLCWNPSTLEQRTGRVDRIGAKAETVGQSVRIYLPFIAETQDEKMYRVVMDRERWFSVVMGEDYKVDLRSTDKLADHLSTVSRSSSEPLSISIVRP